MPLLLTLRPTTCYTAGISERIECSIRMHVCTRSSFKQTFDEISDLVNSPNQSPTHNRQRQNAVEEEQRIEYEAQGYLVLKGTLEEGELDQARVAFDRADEDGGLDDLPNQDAIFIQLAEHPKIFPIVHRIIGDVVQLRSLRGQKVEAGGAGQGWRREMAGMCGVDQSRSTMSVEVVVHLDDVPESGACVSVVPASHRFKSELSFPDVTRMEEMPHQVPLRVKAGTVVVHRGNIWKARNRNGTEHAQRFLAYTFNHCWMRQALPELSSAALDIISASHNLNQLFGDGPDVNRAPGYWHRTVEGYPSSTGLPERKFSELKVVGKGVKPNE